MNDGKTPLTNERIAEVLNHNGNDVYLLDKREIESLCREVQERRRCMWNDFGVEPNCQTTEGSGSNEYSYLPDSGAPA